MSPLQLDPNTTDRLLSGALQPDDAPPGYAEVARLVHAVTAEPSPGELAGKAQAVAAMAETVGWSRSAGRAAGSRPSIMLKAKIAALLVGVSMLSSTSLAVAGALPAPAQNAASTILAKVGVRVAPKAARPVLVGPTAYWLCHLEGGVASDRFEAAPFQMLPEATQVAGQTLKEFCAGVTPRRGPPSLHRPLVPAPGATSPSGNT
jgi:hypothetical protein